VTNVGGSATASTSTIQNTICEGDFISLTASYGGTATTGSWVTSGDGNFDDPNSLTPSYIPGPNDITIGTVDLTFVTDDPIGACIAASSSQSITINPLPVVDAGISISICSTDQVQLNGTISGGSSTGTWSTTGLGTFDDPTNLNAIYTPSSTDIFNGSVALTLSSTDPAGPCLAVSSQIIISFDLPAIVNAGSDATICSSNSITLSGNLSGTGSSSLWSSSGSGTFDDTSKLNAAYTPSSADITSGSITLTLASNDPPGACTVSLDSMVLTFASPPIANAGADTIVCENISPQLSGSFGGSATMLTWTTDGTGTFDDSNSATAIYTPSTTDISNGQVTMILSTDDPGGVCGIATDQMLISFTSDVIVDPLQDLYVCSGDMVALNPIVTGTPGSVKWTSNGTGSFLDSTALNTNYQLSNADEQAGGITLTLSVNVGSCATQNIPVSVFVNNPIDIVQQEIPVDVLIEKIVDVKSGGTFSPGDILTLTLLQQPHKGTAQIDGTTIIYIPSQGTVGADSVQVEVCSNCGQCDSDYIFFDIQNQPPTITPPSAGAEPNTSIKINLPEIVSDLNDNIDFTTFQVIFGPLSGAKVTIDENLNINIDYSGTNFSGSDRLVIQICDFSGACTTSEILIEVAPFVAIVYNAISPNNDQIHDFFKIENIEKFPDNEVIIYNRWGDKVFEMKGYDNLQNIFDGRANVGNSRELVSGTYYYFIHLKTGRKDLTGFLDLKR